jgi:predicted RNA-binding protein YlqC (UPF0109 family)
MQPTKQNPDVHGGSINHTITDPQESLRSIFEQLLAAMTQEPKQATVRLMPSQRKPVLVVRCSKADYGSILGKSRSMLDALKLLAGVGGARHGLEMDLVLDEDGVVTGNHRLNIPAATDWDSEPLEKLATFFCNEILGHCIITIEAVARGQSKLTVTVMEDADWLPDEDTEAGVENALEMVMNCAGGMTGRRIMVELIV